MDILLVEDNPADMRLVREAMTEGGLAARLHWEASGEAALSYLRRSADAAGQPLPDLILLDLNLHGLHGLEVLEQIKSDPLLKAIPVLILSSSSARSDVQDAYAAHANAYLVKPDDFEQFVELVGAIRSYWLTSVLLPGQLG